MHLLNRVSLVGKLKENPHTLLITPRKSIMTFVLDTESKTFDQQQTKFHQQHQVVIKAPLILDFANTYLLKGNLAWIEGRLEYLEDQFGQKTCIVISEEHGFIYPLDAELQASEVQDGEPQDSELQTTGKTPKQTPKQDSK